MKGHTKYLECGEDEDEELHGFTNEDAIRLAGGLREGVTHFKRLPKKQGERLFLVPGKKFDLTIYDEGNGYCHITDIALPSSKKHECGGRFVWTTRTDRKGLHIYECSKCGEEAI